MKSLLQDNNLEMYSTHNKGKSVVAERFIETLKNKIYKYMTSISRNVYTDKLNDIVNKCNNTYHSTMKQIKAELRVEIVIRRKDEKLFFKSKDYDNWFNSWIDKKDFIKQNKSSFSENIWTFW